MQTYTCRNKSCGSESKVKKHFISWILRYDSEHFLKYGLYFINALYIYIIDCNNSVKLFWQTEKKYTDFFNQEKQLCYGSLIKCTQRCAEILVSLRNAHLRFFRATTAIGHFAELHKINTINSLYGVMTQRMYEQRCIMRWLITLHARRYKPLRRCYGATATALRCYEHNRVP